MSSERPVGIAIDSEVGLPGALIVRAQGETVATLRPGQGLPFADSTIDAIHCGPLADGFSGPAQLKLLLECRRSLVPRGTLAVDGARCYQLSAASAALAGFEARHGCFVKPDRCVRGEPLVSIAIPAYNARFFGACLESALAQTYRNIEVVVCDDSPGQEIETLVRERAHGAAVRYERNVARLGPRGNFIRCLERSEGEFVKLLCDDDALAPQCVARQVDAFRQAPDIALATSRRRRIDAAGRALPDQPATVPIVGGDNLIEGRTLANAMVMAGLNSVGEPSTVLFRRADLAPPGYFGFAGAEGHGIIDMATWTALLLKGDAVYLRDALSSFRIHAGQRQHDPAKARRNIQSIRELQAAWLGFALHEGLEPDRLRVKPFPPHGAAWREAPLLGFAARAIERPEL